MQTEDTKTSERELMDAKGWPIQVAVFSGERGCELVNTQKGSDCMRNDISLVLHYFNVDAVGS